MFEITDIAGKMAGIVTVAAFIAYGIVILKGKAIPNRATWFIWIVVAIIEAITYYAVGARDTMWIAIGFIVGNSIIAILSLKYGEGGWTGLDRICLIGSGISIILWWILNSPFIALLTILFIGFLGALPTIRKSYYEPEKESKMAWTLFSAGSIINLLAVKPWAFEIYVYPVYIFLINTIIAILVLRPKN